MIRISGSTFPSAASASAFDVPIISPQQGVEHVVHGRRVSASSVDGAG
jgi:hypothetical protein